MMLSSARLVVRPEPRCLSTRAVPLRPHHATHLTPFPKGSHSHQLHARKPHRRTASVVVRAGFGEDLINKVTVALKNSPVNEGKKALAKAQAGNYDEAAVKAKMLKYIADNPVMVFSWSGCPFCKNAKALLTDVGAKYTALELDTMGAEGKALRAELAKLTDRTSMPNIFIQGQGVGGCNDGPGVATLQREGKLLPLLQAAGAV